MKAFSILLPILFLATFFLACEPEAEPEIVYPNSYLPAYPGSSWNYSNGEQVVVSPSYELHNYQPDISSIEKTASKYVPYYNGSYLYEYSIIQNSTVHPLKKLLEEKAGKEWLVNEINDVKIMRQVTGTIDSMIIELPTETSSVEYLFEDVVVVVEFLDSLGYSKWNTREFYAKDVGLIQVEVNNPFDENDAVLHKQIRSYKINN